MLLLSLMHANQTLRGCSWSSGLGTYALWRSVCLEMTRFCACEMTRFRDQFLCFKMTLFLCCEMTREPLGLVHQRLDLLLGFDLLDEGSHQLLVG